MWPFSRSLKIKQEPNPQEFLTSHHRTPAWHSIGFTSFLFSAWARGDGQELQFLERSCWGHLRLPRGFADICWPRGAVASHSCQSESLPGASVSSPPCQPVLPHLLGVLPVAVPSCITTWKWNILVTVAYIVRSGAIKPRCGNFVSGVILLETKS